jgi:hypothetical protein
MRWPIQAPPKVPDPTPLQLWIKILLMIFITVFAAVAILNKAGIAL